MGLPVDAVTFMPAQVQELNQKLSELRHNVNNHLSLIVAALELIQRKPDLVGRMITTMSEQPPRIVDEIRRFSDLFEHAFGITPDKPLH